MDLTKTISAIIIAIIVASGQLPTDQQLKALYQVGYWDGSRIEVTSDAVYAKNGALYHDGSNQYVELLDYAYDISKWNVTFIAEGTMDGQKGIWCQAIPRDGSSVNGEISFNSRGELKDYIRMPIQGHYEKTKKQIVIYDDSTGKAIWKINLKTGDIKRAN